MPDFCVIHQHKHKTPSAGQNNYFITHRNQTHIVSQLKHNTSELSSVHTDSVYQQQHLRDRYTIVHWGLRVGGPLYKGSTMPSRTYTLAQVDSTGFTLSTVYALGRVEWLVVGLAPVSGKNSSHLL